MSYAGSNKKLSAVVAWDEYPQIRWQVAQHADSYVGFGGHWLCWRRLPKASTRRKPVRPRWRRQKLGLLEADEHKSIPAGRADDDFQVLEEPSAQRSVARHACPNTRGTTSSASPSIPPVTTGSIRPPERAYRWPSTSCRRWPRGREGTGKSEKNLAWSTVTRMRHERQRSPCASRCA